MLPEGRWLDYWQPLTAYEGPARLQVEVPEDRLPVYVRSGSIVPLDVQNDYADHASTSGGAGGSTRLTTGGSGAGATALTLDIYPDAEREATFRLWEHGRGLTELACRVEGGATVVTINGQEPRAYILRLLTRQAPARVELAGVESNRPLAQLSAQEWEAGAVGWRYETSEARTWVRLGPVSGAVVVRLR